MYELYYAPGNANLAVHFLLEELGVPFKLRLVDRTVEAQRSPEYLKLNPNGKIPTLVDGELVVFETGAILIHLADMHPDAGLAPSVGTPARALFYRWMFHLANTVQAQAHWFFYPDKHVPEGDSRSRDAVKAQADADWTEMFRLIDHDLEGRRFLVADKLSVADFYLAMLTRFGRRLTTPTRTLPNLRRHAEQIFGRPAVIRAMSAEGIDAPYF